MVGCGWKGFIGFVRRVRRFARQVGILGQQFLCAFAIGTKDRCWLGLSASVGLSWPILNRLLNGFAAMPLLAGDLPIAFLFKVGSPGSAFPCFHGSVPHASYRSS